jgi:hypothetical protein
VPTLPPKKNSTFASVPISTSHRSSHASKQEAKTKTKQTQESGNPATPESVQR